MSTNSFEKEMRLRLDSMEVMIREMHARVMATTGGSHVHRKGDSIYKIAAREFLSGNQSVIKEIAKNSGANAPCGRSGSPTASGNSNVIHSFSCAQGRLGANNKDNKS
jgi:hypothetical protein